MKKVFPKAKAYVNTDLMAAARAVCGRSKGVVANLGTGSFCCFYNGKKMVNQRPGIGYVLGDEGSGTWFGKALITDFLYGNMPADISALFNADFGLTKEMVINNVYQKPAANAYLASFAKFLNKIRTTAYCQDLLARGFQEFIDSDIKSYPQYHRYKCHFVGSIAYVFSDELKRLCEQNEIHLGKIIRQPIYDLLQFIISRDV